MVSIHLGGVKNTMPEECPPIDMAIYKILLLVQID